MPDVLYEARDGVAVITLNRPEVLNAFTKPLLAELHAALKRSQSEGQRAVLLTGAGRGFCAGQDLAAIKDDYGSGGPDFVELLTAHFHPVLETLHALELPVVAAVNGVAAGAGMSLALNCDLRIAAENARFATAFTRIGLVPDCGMAYILPRLAGFGRASSLLLTGDQIDAQAALAASIVDRVAPAEGFAEAAFALAKSLADGPTRAFVLTRRLLLHGQTATFRDSLALEAQLQAEAGATTDHRGAVEAFLKREPPRFTGR